MVEHKVVVSEEDCRGFAANLPAYEHQRERVPEVSVAFFGWEFILVAELGARSY